LKIEWRAILGYEGIYEVSNNGLVRSLDRIVQYSDGRSRVHKGKELSSWVDKEGYERVRLKTQQRNIQKHIHRLVAEAFIMNDDIARKDTVDHINADKLNNNSKNLQWLSRSDNIKKKAVDGTAPIVRGNAKISFEVARSIRKIRKESNLTIDKIGLLYGLHKTTISKIVNNKVWIETEAEVICS